jgi:hypothetical protein
MRCEWTAATVYAHFTAMLLERDSALKAALNAQNDRLDGMNEFRESLKDAQATFVTRTELYAIAGVTASIGAIIGALAAHALR